MAAPLLHLIAGARPNFMKLAPLVRALRADGRLDWKLIHTGQHHDAAMSGVFFDELGLPPPDVSLDCHGGGHARLTAAILQAYEPHLLADRPAACVVVGDVDSTLACALAARKLGVPVAHVEAGLRSGDMTMPEEINRRATDAIADWLFTTEPSAAAHLRREGHPDTRIVEVRDGKPKVVANLAGIGSLRGSHNAQNAAAAFAACAALGLAAEEIAAGFRSYPGLKHRMEELGRIVHEERLLDDLLEDD